MLRAWKLSPASIQKTKAFHSASQSSTREGIGPSWLTVEERMQSKNLQHSWGGG